MATELKGAVEARKALRKFAPDFAKELRKEMAELLKPIAKKGFHKAFRDDEKQSDVYWLAWECLRTSGEVVKSYGAEFLETLAKVEVLDDDPLE